MHASSRLEHSQGNIQAFAQSFRQDAYLKQVIANDVMNVEGSATVPWGCYQMSHGRTEYIS